MLQFTDPERVDNKDSSCGNSLIFFGWENRDFGEETESRWEQIMNDQVAGRGKEGKSSEVDCWGQPVQQKPGAGYSTKKLWGGLQLRLLTVVVKQPEKVVYCDQNWCLAKLSEERHHPITVEGRCRDPDSNITQNCGILQGGEKSVEAKAVNDTTGRLTQSIILDSQGLTKNEQITKDCRLKIDA